MSTSSSPRSSAACPSIASSSVHSAGTGSARSRASGARRSGTSSGTRRRSACGSRNPRAVTTAYSIGLHHLAFEASSRGAVDERADWLRSSGAEIESEPQDYTYAPGYYAVFFFDPDGMKLEIVHVPALAA